MTASDQHGTGSAGAAASRHLALVRSLGGTAAGAGGTRPVSAADWDLSLAATPGHLLTQTPRWATVVERATGWRAAARRYDRPGGRFLVLPLFARWRGGLRLLSSAPHGWGYGGLLASDGRVTGEDAAAVALEVAREGAARATLVPSPFVADPWGVLPWPGERTRYLCQAVDLRGGAQEVERGYSRNVRGSLRRAGRAGLTVTRGVGGAGLDEFVALHLLSAQRWARSAGRPAVVGRWQSRLGEPPHHLRTVARELGDDCVVWTAWEQGRPAASLVVLSHGAHALAWRAAMDQELSSRTQAATWLHHLAVQEALQQRRSWYSFGESDEGSGLAAYKAKFGAVALPWAAHHLERLPVTRMVCSARSVHQQVTGRLGSSRTGGGRRG